LPSKRLPPAQPSTNSSAAPLPRKPVTTKLPSSAITPTAAAVAVMPPKNPIQNPPFPKQPAPLQPLPPSRNPRPSLSIASSSAPCNSIARSSR
jgi:hypothetical protein